MEKDRTISLQAAIDAIKNADVCVAWNGCTDCEDIADIAVRATKRSVVDSVEALPSAQSEIIRCKDCVNWDTTWQIDWAKNYHYCPLVDGLRNGNWYCADAERRTDECVD